RADPSGHINLSVGDDSSAVPIDNAFQGTYAWGAAPVTYHPGIRNPYPAARSKLPVPPAKKVIGPSSGPCARDPRTCLTPIQDKSDKPQAKPQAISCGTAACVTFGSTAGGSGSGRAKAGLGILAAGGGDGCAANAEECQKLANALAALAQ